MYDFDEYCKKNQEEYANKELGKKLAQHSLEKFSQSPPILAVIGKAVKKLLFTQEC
jgi:hypothetical protein